MATVTIDSTTPSASINLAVLKSLIDKLLDLADRKSLVLGTDEYVLLNELRYAVTTGVPSTNIVTGITITY